MKGRYLEITSRKGKPLAAYLYLPREPEDAVAMCEPAGRELVVDRAADGRVIGIEVLTPSPAAVPDLYAELLRLGLPPAAGDELRPLTA